MKTLDLTKDIKWIGSIDKDLKIFDIIMETEFGTSYNSYLINGSEKVAVVETVKVKFFDEYLEKLKEATNLEDISYIVVNHTEPDHVGSVEKLLEYVPNAKIVGSKMAINYLKEITNKDFEAIVANEDLELSLGNKTLSFISAPFLHWPDSMYTYIKEDKVLLTCDSFGSHYAAENVLFTSMGKDEYENYKKSLKYYFDVIFAPFKKHMLKAINKLEDLEIKMIMPGHGPVLDNHFGWVVDCYKEWSKETPKGEQKLVVMPYVSAYGYTKECAQIIKEVLENNGIKTLDYEVDIANYNAFKQEILEKINVADGLLLGSSTINGDAVPLLYDLTLSLSPLVHSGKIASSFGSYGWSGEAVGNMNSRLKQLRMKMVDGYRFKFKMSDDEKASAKEFANIFAQAVLNGKV